MYKATIRRICSECKGEGFKVISAMKVNCKRCDGKGRIIEDIDVLEINPADEE